jgi:Patatin-like phospholipase
MRRNRKDESMVIVFNDVFRDEISVINERRAGEKPPREAIVLGQEAIDSGGEPVLTPNDDANVVGLGLSGGGIRSTAFCLGALQALNETEVLKRVDYLSTVSGGGYIGCCLSACLESTKGNFPFESRTVEDETPSMQHIRDYSNYLFPHGASDLLHNASIYVRGIVANFVLIVPFLLFFASVTIISNANWNEPNIFNVKLYGFEVPIANSLGKFVVTSCLALALLAVIVIWGLLRSTKSLQNQPELPSRFNSFVGAMVLVAMASAFFELQLYLIHRKVENGNLISLAESINWVSVTLGPLAALIAIFKSPIETYIKSTMEAASDRFPIARYLTRLGIFVAALVVPLLLWLVYLNLSVWGLCIITNVYCDTTPNWLRDVFEHSLLSTIGIEIFYGVIAIICLILALFLRPNANSLHPLYRDRLAKAFLFKPQPTLQKGGELESLRLKLSELSGKYGPYHLINTALNIQNSRTANQRGRNADFFLLSQKFIGSESTGYVATKDLEKIATGLDLATAMAVSGAAASSNMGAESIKVLTPTLALMNIRLGYWLRNPLRVGKAEFWKFRNIWANFYFLVELLGLLNERRKSVYLTDGGHIDNLGIYELLKRRCRVIIAIDAEADPQMAFGSFNTLVRYGRIDLGLEIDLPWQQLADKSLATGKAIDKHGHTERLNGPHCVIGQITYPTGSKGILVYIKSSLSGDENDYVLHYKRRYSAFPHETTLDQMFSEEQFEAYRALGYHAAYGLFDRRDSFAHLAHDECLEARSQFALLDQLFPRVTTTPGQHQNFVGWLSTSSVCSRTTRPSAGQADPIS